MNPKEAIEIETPLPHTNVPRALTPPSTFRVLLARIQDVLEGLNVELSMGRTLESPHNVVARSTDSNDSGMPIVISVAHALTAIAARHGVTGIPPWSPDKTVEAWAEKNRNNPRAIFPMHPEIVKWGRQLYNWVLKFAKDNSQQVIDSMQNVALKVLGYAKQGKYEGMSWEKYRNHVSVIVRSINADEARRLKRRPTESMTDDEGNARLFEDPNSINSPAFWDGITDLMRVREFPAMLRHLSDDARQYILLKTDDSMPTDQKIIADPNSPIPFVREYWRQKNEAPHTSAFSNARKRWLGELRDAYDDFMGSAV